MRMPSCNIGMTIPWVMLLKLAVQILVLTLNTFMVRTWFTFGSPAGRFSW